MPPKNDVLYQAAPLTAGQGVQEAAGAVADQKQLAQENRELKKEQQEWQMAMDLAKSNRG